MELNMVVMLAAWTGIVWAAGALSTWLAVKPLRRRVDVLEAWKERHEGADQKFRRDTLEYVACCEEWFRADKQAEEGLAKWRDAVGKLQVAQSAMLDSDKGALREARGRIERLEAVSEALQDSLWAMDAKVKAVSRNVESRGY